jgi:hypothetical protein
VIDDEVRALALASPMIILAGRTARGDACLGRGLGIALDVDGGDAIEVLVSGRQWPDVVEALAPGASMSLTICRAADYRAFQLKGTVRSREAAGADGLAHARRYQEAVVATLGALGVPEPLVTHWTVLDELVAVRMAPTRTYDQTPGPAAGRAHQPNPPNPPSRP